ncbi:homoserine O-succinyltransferase [Chryseomicrobium sp. FSL W7-1435]|uniref:homoserine O-acetyltransferase MetA n=1 Tax=Chryseomicrobium sp. FSL W7-1435 TaxID=2921704 RepID=UPI00315A5BE3
MPINLPKDLPVIEKLRNENIFVMDLERAHTQDIRPLEVLIVNLMPEKEKTEHQLLRLLGNTPLQTNVTFLRMASYQPKNVSSSHLEQFYVTFDAIKDRRFDGMIITGAPVEQMPFEEVAYWPEIVTLLFWAKTHVTSTLSICWGAQAVLYQEFGVDKEPLPKKCSGVYPHTLLTPHSALVRGFNDTFLAPHSRYTTVSYQEILKQQQLEVVAVSQEAGVFLVQSKDQRHIMATGHLEYDATTLQDEYLRDVAKGIAPEVPANYFPGDDPTKNPSNTWRSHTHLLFSNWLNYYVYQQTPYDWSKS